MSGKNCQICGKPSGMYPLCKEHLSLKNEGKVIKNEKTGEWELIKETTEEDKNHKCIVCGEPAPNGPQCKSCYYEMLEYKDQIDKNEKIQYFNSYYFNLSNNLFRMNNFDKIKTNCNKLFAIATLTKELFNSDTLSNKVINDIERVIEKKKETQKISTKYSEQQDAQNERLNLTIDGHIVKSRGEQVIDDFLYTQEILHSYSPTVDEIDTEEEEAIEADWFLPIQGITKGIYIEYWGMNTEKYLKNKERKIKQYKKNNIPFIGIEKEEPFEDINAFKRNLFSEIQRICKEYYNIDWKSARKK